MALIETTHLKLAARRRQGRTLNYDTIATVAAVLDVVLIVGSSITAGIAYHWLAFGVLIDPSPWIGVGITLAAAFVLTMSACGLYKPTALLSFGTQFRAILLAGVGIMAFLASVAFFLKIGEIFSRASMLAFMLLAMTVLTVSRIVWRRHLHTAMALSLIHI